MSANTNVDGRSVAELRGMDEQTARSELTVVEYERWEQLNSLVDEHEATKDEWDAEDERVEDLVVHADMDELGTHVELYGNDLLVYADPDDEGFRAAVESFDDARSQYDGMDPDEIDVDDIDDGVMEDMAWACLDFLDAVLVEFNGVAWGDLPDDECDAILEQCREKWGPMGTVQSMVDVMAAIYEEQEEQVSTVESFLGEERRGNR